MDGGELGRAVSSPQCPRLQKLGIVYNLGSVRDVSIFSESLERLNYSVLDTGKLEINAPMLKDIDVTRAAEACIVAPKLEMVRWSGGYNPGLHQFAVSGRHLQSLYIMHSTFLGILISSTRLMERYDSAKELIVSLALHRVICLCIKFHNKFNVKCYVCKPEKRFYNFVKGSQAELNVKLDNFRHNLVKTPAACIEVIASLSLRTVIAILKTRVKSNFSIILFL
jgi:hypothetical protein